MLEIVVVFAAFGLLGVVLLSLNALLGPRATNPAKETPFECGSPPLERDIKPFPISFGLVAFVFLLFDVEIVFFFPWALVFRSLLGPAGWLMAGYGLVLAAGFVYAWKKGVFVWD